MKNQTGMDFAAEAQARGQARNTNVNVNMWKDSQGKTVSVEVQVPYSGSIMVPPGPMRSSMSAFVGRLIRILLPILALAGAVGFFSIK